MPTRSNARTVSGVSSITIAPALYPKLPFNLEKDLTAVGLVNTGSGHIFLAYATPEERTLMLEAQGEGAPETLLPSLTNRLKQVREQGYESSPSSQTRGVTNLSVPILGPAGTVLAALTCPYTERLDNDAAPDHDKVLALLASAGAEVSNRSLQPQTE